MAKIVCQLWHRKRNIGESVSYQNAKAKDEENVGMKISAESEIIGESGESEESVKNQPKWQPRRLIANAKESGGK
jgi:hypothetical protein